jgi:TorA maturation chaperone TorD
MDEFLSHEEYRGDSYKLLSECYYPPDEELIRMLIGLDRSRGGLYSEITRKVPGISDVDLLKIDYSKLFIGPYGMLAPPYGSIYLESPGTVMGDSTMDIKKRYREEGLDICLKEVPDHIAIELEFMYFLVFKEVNAIRNHESASTASYLEKQKDFLESHLGVWVFEFADKVAANAQSDFYRDLAGLTKSFVTRDLRLLSDNSILLAS